MRKSARPARKSDASANRCCASHQTLWMIVNLEGNGADAHVQVNFRKAGTKWLALGYAKLTVL